jgi:hypothetical protein
MSIACIIRGYKRLNEWNWMVNLADAYEVISILQTANANNNLMDNTQFWWQSIKS